MRDRAPEVHFASAGITPANLARPVMLWHRTASAAGRRAFFVSLLASLFSAGDYFMRRSLILAAAALAMLAASIGGASAQQMQRVQVGILECRGGASVGFIVGSVTNLGCVLRADGMPEDRYIATIRKVGLDLGITQESALAWGVFAPVARLGPGGSLRRLRRRAGQRDARRRRRRQRAGRRFRQFDRAAAAERAGPGRHQHRCRIGKPGTAAGALTKCLPVIARTNAVAPNFWRRQATRRSNPCFPHGGRWIASLRSQ